MSKVVDCFRFFNEVELLELRFRMLNNYVEKFVVVEGTRTFSGHAREELLAKKSIRELGLPEERFIVLEVELPDNDDNTQNNEVDMVFTSLCASSSDSYKNSINARTRERIQLDYILKVVDQFDNDTVFIISDCDEIVQPEAIEYLSQVTRNNPDCLLKVPLIQLEGRADLRAWSKYSNNPQLFDQRLFFCTRGHLKKATPTQMRYNIKNPFPVVYVTENGARVEDLGWHFSWMGDNERIKLKQRSTAHYADQIQSALIPDMSSEELQRFIDAWEPKDGGFNPWGNTDIMLKDFPHDLLPKDLLETEHLREFFIGSRETPIPVIGVPIVNGVHWLRRLIDSIDYPVRELFVINNNGRDQITEELDKLSKIDHSFVQKIRICHLPHNIGVGGAWNLIIKSYLMSPYWIIMNNDVCFTPGLLKRMSKEAQNSDIGMVHGQNTSWGGGAYDLFLIKDWVVQKCGLFDENLYPAYAEDVDYAIRVRLENIKYSILNVNYPHGEHNYRTTGSQTYRIEPELEPKIHRSRIINETQYLTQKWGENYFSGCVISTMHSKPFDKKNYTTSHTTYDLGFVRQKYLGF